jgi:alanine racemase
MGNVTMPPFRSYALVSRDQIVRNYREICRVVGPQVQALAVVKANAYGHGAAEVSRALAAEGAGWFAVATVDEGAELRREGIRGRILVMGGCLPFEHEALTGNGLTPAVHSLSDLRALDDLARACGRPLAVHLKIDSGMGRLGVLAGAVEVLAALKAAPHIRLEGLMTHFASADDFSSDQTDSQLGYFEEIRKELRSAGVRPEYVHACATNGIGYGRAEAWYNLVRAGLALYGYVSRPRGTPPPQRLNVKPALEWKARLITVKDLPAGASVGYGATFTVPSPMRIGVAAAGYADGVFRHLSNRGQVIAGGKLSPIVGVVSMDMITIDLSHAPRLTSGDPVTLLGSEEGVTLDAHQIAQDAGTIPYSVLCAITQRVRRIYI